MWRVSPADVVGHRRSRGADSAGLEWRSRTRAMARTRRRGWTAAGNSAVGTLRYGMAGWVAAPDAGTRSRGPPARPRHLRYEKRHSRRDARDASTRGAGDAAFARSRDAVD